MCVIFDSAIHMCCRSPRGHFPIDLDEICQNIVRDNPAAAFSGGPKNGAGMSRLKRARSRSVAFHAGNIVFSKDRCGGHRGPSPIDLDEICQNLVAFSPAEDFSVGPPSAPPTTAPTTAPSTALRTAPSTGPRSAPSPAPATAPSTTPSAPPSAVFSL